MSSSISISEPRGRWSIGWALTAFLTAGVLVWLLYTALAAAVLRNSVVLRSAKEMADAKLAPLRNPGRKPYLIVVAGSNGLYSIDSAALSKLTGMPVANASMQWSYTYYMLDRIAGLVRPGDILLLPLEYEYFTTVDEQPKLEACYRIMQDRTGIAGTAEFVRLLMRCSPYLVFDALFAETLAGIGVSYPGQPIRSVISPEGDILENAAGVNRWRQPLTVTLQAPARGFAADRLSSVLGQIEAKGATVLLSYPVRPEKTGNFPVLSQGWNESYAEWAKRSRAFIVSDPDRHLFPVSCFFDSPYHLHRGCTTRNSEAYARAIADFLKNRPR